MNVCMFTTSFPRYPGDAAGQFVFELAAALAKRHSVTVVAPGADGLPSYETVENVTVCRFHYFFPHRYEKLAYGDGIVDNLRHNPFCRLLIPFFMFFFWLKGIRVARRCDVVHAHWAFSGLIARLGKMIHKRPIVMTLRGSDVNVHLAGARNSAVLLRWIVKGCDYVTTVSNDLLYKLEQILEHSSIDYEAGVVPNGISLESFSPYDRSSARATLGLPAQVGIVLYAGRITEAKGVDNLVEAMPIVLKEYKDALFALLGEGNMAAKISRMCKDRGMEHNIRLLGNISHEKMPLWLNAADMLVLSSLSEGRPNIVMEAMACGVPVVATQVGGVPELIQDGHNGFLVPPKDPEALGRAIVAVLATENARDVLGRRGREVVESLGLTWKTSADKMTAIYEMVLPQR